MVKIVIFWPWWPVVSYSIHGRKKGGLIRVIKPVVRSSTRTVEKSPDSNLLTKKTVPSPLKREVGGSYQSKFAFSTVRTDFYTSLHPRCKKIIVCLQEGQCI